MTKRLKSLAAGLLAALLLSLSSCNNSPLPSKAPEPEEPGEAVPLTQPKEEEKTPEPQPPQEAAAQEPLPAEENVLQQALQDYLCQEQPQAVLAGVYLGKPGGRQRASLEDYFQEHFPLLTPLLLEIPQERMLGQGEELFCLVPRDDSSSLAINAVRWEAPEVPGDSPQPQVEEVLYRDEYAQPVLIFVGRDEAYDQPDVELFALDERGAALAWYPQADPDTGLLDSPLDESGRPLCYDFCGFGGEEPQPGWLTPTTLGLADTTWHSDCGWDLRLFQGQRVEIYQLPDGRTYSGIWELEGDRLYLSVSDELGTLSQGGYPLGISLSGEELFISTDPESGAWPEFLDGGQPSTILTLVYETAESEEPKG